VNPRGTISLLLVAGSLFACRPRHDAPAPLPSSGAVSAPSAPAPSALAPASSPIALPPASPPRPKGIPAPRPRTVLESVDAFQVVGAVLVATEEGEKRTLGRIEGDKLVDEARLTVGLLAEALAPREDGLPALKEHTSYPSRANGPSPFSRPWPTPAR